MISASTETGSGYYKWIVLVLLQIAIGLCSIIYPFKVAISLLFLPTIVLILMANHLFAYVLGIFLLPVWSLTLTGQVEAPGHIDLRFSDVLFLIAGLGWLLRGMIDRHVEIKGSHLDFFLFVLFCWMFLSILWCPTFLGGMKEFLRKLNGLFIFFITINVIRNRRDLDFALIVWIVAGFLAALFAFHEVVTQILGYIPGLSKGDIHRWGWLRTAALKEGANKLGFFLNICLMMAISRFLFVKRLAYRIPLFICIVVMISALITTLSRSSLLGFVVGTGLLLYLMKTSAKKVVLSAAGSVLVFLLVLSPSYRDILFKRYVGIVEPEETQSYIGRTQVWGVALRSVADHPIMGTGAGGFHELAEVYGAERLKSPHNLYIYVAAEFGLVGLLLFLLVCARFGLLARQGLKSFLSGKERFIMASLIVGVTIYAFQGLVINFLLIEGEFWALLGLTVAAIKIYTQGETR